MLTEQSHTDSLFIILLILYTIIPAVCKFPDSIKMQFFSLAPQPLLLLFRLWLMVVSDAVSSILTRQLSQIHWSMCSLSPACYSRWPPIMVITSTSPHFFVTFHPFVNFSAGLTVIAILSHHSFVNFKFLALWPQKWDHRSFILFCEFYTGTTTLNVPHNYHYSKDNRRQYRLLFRPTPKGMRKL